jgi:hypothetical protein
MGGSSRLAQLMKYPPNATWGVALLGRDEETWGENVGVRAIDPDICPEPGVCPEYNDRLPSDDDKKDKDTKIHMVIASFRDRLCPRTLYNAFHKAEYPHRLFIRVLQQIDPTSHLVDDADCWEMFCRTYNGKDGSSFDCNEFRANVEIVSMDSRIAKGPCDARSKLSALIEYDYRHANDGKHRLSSVATTDYCLQTDSHMDFNKHFDRGLIEMFHRAENDRAVLSTYVASMEQTDTNPKNVPHLCMIEWRATWRNWGTKYIEHAKKPKLTNLVWGAGMSFHKCHAELNVPYDPYLDNVFDGEETSRGIRFFTHGYDVYTPDQVLVTHDYDGHQKNPVVHTWGGKGNGGDQNLKNGNSGFDLLDKVNWNFMDRIEAVRPEVVPKGTRRVNVVMGTAPDADPEVAETIQKSRYGLGDLRTLEEAYRFAGFDPVEHEMIENHCGNLKWVPYELPRSQGDDYGVGSSLRRPLWNEEPSMYAANTEVVAMGSTKDKNPTISDLAKRDAKDKVEDGTVAIKGGDGVSIVVVKERIQVLRASQNRRIGLICVLILGLVFVVKKKGKRAKSEKAKV